MSSIPHISFPTKIYYDIPPCPQCNSPITGHYIASKRESDQDWVIIEALRHGEIAQLAYDSPLNNCFCLECGYEWYQDIKASLKTMQYVKEQRKIRHTDELLRAYKEEHPQEKKQGFLSKIL